MKINMIEHEIVDKVKYPNEYMIEIEIKGKSMEKDFFVKKLNLFINDFKNQICQNELEELENIAIQSVRRASFIFFKDDKIKRIKELSKRINHIVKCNK